MWLKVDVVSVVWVVRVETAWRALRGVRVGRVAIARPLLPDATHAALQAVSYVAVGLVIVTREVVTLGRFDVRYIISLASH